VKAALLGGNYLPREVRAVDIPKPSGGVTTSDPSSLKTNSTPANPINIATMHVSAQ